MRARSLHYRFLSFQSGLTSLCFVDDLCQILGMFSLNSIGCVTKCGSHGHSGGKYKIGTDACKANAQIFIQKDLSNILTVRWRVYGATKWIKNNLLMILRGSDCVKNMLNSTISMSYPDVVIACIEHKVSLKAFRAIDSSVGGKHDNNMKDYSWWLTDHHNC